MKSNVKKSMEKISSYSYWGLLFVALMSFIFLVAFKADFYNFKFLPKMGTDWAYYWGYFLAIIIESARFWFILASTNDKIENNKQGFRLGIIASLGLVAYDWQVCEQMGNYWDESTVFFTNVFRAVVILGLIIEIRLSWMLTKKEEEVEEEKDNNFDISKMSPEVQEAYYLSLLSNLGKDEKK